MLFALASPHVVCIPAATGLLQEFNACTLCQENFMAQRGIDVFILVATGTEELELTCGRPLGMRFDRYGINLIVADAYFGLLEVNTKARTVSTLVPPTPGINGKPFRFVNDLDIARDGTIYFTDTSSKWQRRHFRHSLFEGDNSGRLMAYHPKTGDMEVLMEGLYFANGVQISPEGDHLLVVETLTARIMKYECLLFLFLTQFS